MYLKKELFVNKEVTKVCIDDFAMKKRHKYGTVMVDIETNKIVDILNSREVDKVAEWLKQFKNIDTVSRDGSVTYNSAIENAFPNAIQISDRFHLLKNLTDYAKEGLKSIVKKSITVHSDELIEHKESEGKNQNEFEYRKKSDLIREVKRLHQKGISTIEICNALNISKNRVQNYSNMTEADIKKFDTPSNYRIRKEKRCEEIWKIAQKVHEEYKTCKNYAAIGGKLNLDFRTVKKYLKITKKPQVVDLEKLRETKLSNYIDEVINLHNSGHVSREIFEIIKEKGYTGSSGTLRAFLADVTRKEKSKYKIIDNIKISTLTTLLYKDVSKVKNITEEIFKKIKEQNKKLAEIYYIVESFKTVLFSKDDSILDLWLQDIGKLDIPEINKFIAGVYRDITAVKNAITLEYNNGLAEGSVNKIKVIKRIMYGRCSFDLLRRKVLAPVII